MGRQLRRSSCPCLTRHPHRHDIAVDITPKSTFICFCPTLCSPPVRDLGPFPRLAPQEHSTRRNPFEMSQLSMPIVGATDAMQGLNQTSRDLAHCTTQMRNSDSRMCSTV